MAKRKAKSEKRKAKSEKRKAKRGEEDNAEAPRNAEKRWKPKVTG